MTMGTASTMACSPRCSACSCRAAPRCRPNDSRRAHARAPRRPPHRRDGRRRSAPVEDPHARGVRERDARQCRARRLDQRRRPPAGARRGASASRSTLDDFDTLVRDIPTLVDLMPARPVPDGGLRVRRRHRRGSPRPSATCCIATRSPSPARRSARTTPAPRCFDREVIRPLDNPVKPAGSRHRGAARQPRPARRRDQAVGRGTRADARTRGRALVWDSLRGLPRGRRRPRARRRARRRPRRAQRRPEGLSRACRRSATAAAAQDPRGGRHATWCGSRMPA